MTSPNDARVARAAQIVALTAARHNGATPDPLDVAAALLPRWVSGLRAEKNPGEVARQLLVIAMDVSSEALVVRLAQGRPPVQEASE